MKGTSEEVPFLVLFDRFLGKTKISWLRRPDWEADPDHDGKTMAIRTFCGFLVTVMLVSLLPGCGARERVPENAFPTSPVIGVAQIDGKPVGGVRVTATPEPGGKIAYPISVTCGESGDFSFSTYRAGDGLPEGSYVLTFEDLMAQAGVAGTDRLKGRYVDPKKSEHQFQVTLGKPVDLGALNLKSK